MNKGDFMGFLRKISRPPLTNAELVALTERLRAGLKKGTRKKRQRKPQQITKGQREKRTGNRYT